LEKENRADQGQADNRRHCNGRMVKPDAFEEIGEGQRQSAEQSYPHLLPDDMQVILPADLIQRDPAHDLRGGLTAGIAAGVHQHRNVGSQNHDLAQSVLIAGDDAAGESRGDHQKQQPRDSFFPGFKDIRLEIRLVRRNDGGHFFNIFRCFLLDDVNDVIDGDDADHAVLSIHHRHRIEVVLLEHLRDHFLVVMRPAGNHVAVHDCADAVVRLFQQQRPQRHGADQLSFGIKHIAGVDRLRIHAQLADALDGFIHIHVFFQIDELDRHHAAGGIIRILQQMVDVLAGIRAGVFQDFLDDIRRHLFQQIDRIIRLQIIDDDTGFLFRKFGDDVLLAVRFQHGENIGSHVLGKDPEQLQHVLVFHVFHDGGDIRLIHVFRLAAQRGILLLIHEILNFSEDVSLFVCCHGSPPQIKVFCMRVLPPVTEECQCCPTRPSYMYTSSLSILPIAADAGSSGYSRGF